VAPVTEALGFCTTAAQAHPAVVVLFSGGKDSLAVLDLCARVFPRVEAAFMYLVPGLRFLEDHIDHACVRLGVKLHKVPHWDTARLMRHAVLRWHNAAPEALPTRNLRLPDVERALRAKTGIQWIASGWRACDGMQRRLILRQWTPVAQRWWRLFPVANWRDRDVLAYLRARKWGVPHQVSKGKARAHNSGFGLDAPGLSWLYRVHPGDYARVVEVFPFADAMRWAYDQRHAKESPAPLTV
jgi:sulfate adenylyltransferase subunit 2